MARKSFSRTQKQRALYTDGTRDLIKMTELNDFPVYGICGDDNKAISLSLRGEAEYCAIIIERDLKTAMTTLAFLNTIAVKIEELFNLQQVEDFRRAFDWTATYESSGFTGLEFGPDGKGGVMITRCRFTGWGEIIQDCF